MLDGVVGHDQVGLAVPVQIGHGNRTRGLLRPRRFAGAAKVPSPFPISTLTSSPNVFAVTMSGMLSPAQVGHDHRRRAGADGIDLLRLEGAVAVAQQDTHRVVDVVGGDDVGNAVAGQVRDRHGSVVRANRVVYSRAWKVPSPLPISTLTVPSA